MKILKKIYNSINIDNDDSAKMIDIENMFKYKEYIKNGGGDITYKVVNPEINSESLKEYRFKPNSSSIDNSTPNIIIIGGGPVGLYMSILLQKLYGEIMKIYVLEKQRGGTDERSLERGQVLILGTLNTTIKPDEINTFKSNIPNNIEELLLKKEKNEFSFSFLNIILNEEINLMPINILEYKLANYAQTIGVNILHTVDTITMDNIHTYQNRNTKFIFDAVGGRFRDYKYVKETKYNENNYTYSGYNITKPNLILIHDLLSLKTILVLF